MRLNRLFNVGLVLGLTAAAAQPLAAASLADDPAVQKNMLSGLREALEFKAGVSAEERKLGAGLLIEQRLLTGKAVPSAFAARQAAAARRAAPVTSVFKLDAEPTAALLADIEALGGDVLAVAPQQDILSVRLPVSALASLSQHQDVRRIRRVSRGIPQAVENGATAAHNVAGLSPARTGAGVRIGVISNQVKPLELQRLVEAGTLPADNTGQLLAIDWTQPAADRESLSATWTDQTSGAWADTASGTSDGLAMLSVIFDVAPDAELLFTATNGAGVTGMAQAIDALANPPAGAEYLAADIIVDDLFFFDQAPFEDDAVADAAIAAVAAGAFYITSAGDFGNDVSNTATTYEADFNATTPVNSCDSQDQNCNDNFDFFFGSGGVEVHDFGAGVTTVTLNEDLAELCLFWSEPLTQATSDYDLFIFDNTGNFVDFGENFLGDPTDPKECVRTPASLVSGNVAVIAAVSQGSDTRFLHLSALPTNFLTNATARAADALSYTSNGAIRGHAGAAEVLAVGAATAPEDAQDPPQPRAFVATDTVAGYSSDGYRRVFYDATGAALTPGNLTASGGQVRIKPNVIAADGVELTLPSGAVVNDVIQLGPEIYAGTSSSAAHAAGLVALMIEADTAAVPGDLLAAVNAGVVDLNPAETDVTAGHGAMDVSAAVTAIANPAPVRSVTLTPGVASVELDFLRPADDYDTDFTFTATCQQVVQGGDPEPLFTDQVVNFANLPVTYSATPGALTSCAVTAVDGAFSGPASDTGSVAADAIPAPASLELTGLTAGTQVVFTGSPGDVGNLAYLLQCTETATSGEGGGSELFNATSSPGTQQVEATPGYFVDCTVTPQVEVLSVVTTGEAISQENVQAGTMTQAGFALTPDSGGFSVQFTPDTSVAEPGDPRLTFAVTCSAGGQVLANVDNVSLAPGATSGFFEFDAADGQQEVSCTASSTLTVNGQTSAVQLADLVGTVTPEEAIAAGLPIWLLYQATQSSEPAPQ